jgi:hypothetical protein
MLRFEAKKERPDADGAAPELRIDEFTSRTTRVPGKSRRVSLRRFSQAWDCTSPRMRCTGALIDRLDTAQLEIQLRDVKIAPLGRLNQRFGKVAFGLSRRVVSLEKARVAPLRSRLIPAYTHPQRKPHPMPETTEKEVAESLLKMKKLVDASTIEAVNKLRHAIESDIDRIAADLKRALRKKRGDSEL